MHQVSLVVALKGLFRFALAVAVMKGRSAPDTGAAEVTSAPQYRRQRVEGMKLV